MPVRSGCTRATSGLGPAEMVTQTNDESPYARLRRYSENGHPTSACIPSGMPPVDKVGTTILAIGCSFRNHGCTTRFYRRDVMGPSHECTKGSSEVSMSAQRNDRLP